MAFLNIFGKTDISISDTLFNNKNIKYVSIFHKTCEVITKKPETTGTITFMVDDMEGEKKFIGKNVMEVITQMAKFIETLK